MANDSATFYMQASSTQPGALGIFQAYGPEEALAVCLDARLGTKRELCASNPLVKGELRYGWLYGADGAAIDEAMLAKPSEGMRVLMTHGGAAVSQAIASHFEAYGIVKIDDWFDEKISSWTRLDPLFDPLLASCVTEAQAAAVLESREAAARGGGAAAPAHVLATHRLVLAGPPNAGKSSLLNRLSGYDRAFVHEEAGATRDVVDELIDLGGYAVLAGDLPGFSGGATELEVRAWDKAAERLRLAEIVLFVVDASREWDDAADRAGEAVAGCLAGQRVLVVLNKSDLPRKVSGEPWTRHFPGAGVVSVCSLPVGNAYDVLAEAMEGFFETT